MLVANFCQTITPFLHRFSLRIGLLVRVWGKFWLSARRSFCFISLHWKQKKYVCAKSTTINRCKDVFNPGTIKSIKFEIPVANPTQLAPKRRVKIKTVVWTVFRNFSMFLFRKKKAWLHMSLILYLECQPNRKLRESIGWQSIDRWP